MSQLAKESSGVYHSQKTLWCPYQFLTPKILENLQVCLLFPRHKNCAYDLSIIARMGDQAYNLNCQKVWLLTSTLN